MEWWTRFKAERSKSELHIGAGKSPEMEPFKEGAATDSRKISTAIASAEVFKNPSVEASPVGEPPALNKDQPTPAHNSEATVEHAYRPEMSGPDLALRCYELNELATRVRDLLFDDLARLGAELSVYRFAHRPKGQENIQNKVLRKRDEIKAQSKRDAQPRLFHAEDVTDAWGCRFVTLFQSQILDVMSRVFRLIETWRGRVTIS